MALSLQLLGPPLLLRDGVVYAAPRGKKVWALLAYLAVCEQPPTRQQLAELLFPDAEDPASALRWNLSELRRLLGGPETVGSGNVVTLRLPAGSTIDVHVLLRGTSLDAVELPGLGRELLEGVNVEASPGFAAWLLGERRRLQAIGGAALREGALRALAAGRSQRAVELATRLIGADPLNQDAHVLLVRAFAATGDEVAVERQLAASIDLFRRELGEEVGRELYEAARMAPDDVDPPASRAAVQALLETGEAAAIAGAVEVGVDDLQAAVAGARELGERKLEAAALLALGTALVHATKGRDEEGSAALHRAVAAAESVDDRKVAASAHRELGYVELLRGDYPRGELLLSSAEELAEGDPLELAGIRAVRGACFADVGAHGIAHPEFEASIDLARSAGSGRWTAWATCVLGRSLLQRGELAAAEEALVDAIELARAEHWTAFLAFPEALLAEVWVRQGRHGEAGDAFEHAFELGRRVDDACWEAYGARGIGLLAAAKSDLEGAIASIQDAGFRCARQPDTHRWVRAYVLDALCAVATCARHPDAGRWVAELASLADRTGMREFSVHAYLYRRDLGDHAAVEAARAIGVGLQNPHLQTLIAPDGPPILEDLLGRA